MDKATLQLHIAIRAQVSEDFAAEPTGHDLAHLDRVFGIAERLRSSEGGDPLVLTAACYVHDYHRVLEGLDGRGYAGGVSGDAVKYWMGKALEAVGFPVKLLPRVYDCVEFTDRFSFSGDDLRPVSVEARILRDADNLDALGAIGIARAFIFGGALGEPIWVDGVEPSGTYVPGRTTSVVHHLYEKILRLKDDMLTAAGRGLAEERHDFVVLFLDRLSCEMQPAREIGLCGRP